MCLIYAGALGNLIDSAFYGIIFNKGAKFNINNSDTLAYEGIAKLSLNGYDSFLHGNVVDMIHCPIFRSRFPSWLPFVGGDSFEFFNMIFNIADASISVGVITLLIFQKSFFRVAASKNAPEVSV